MSKVAYRLDGNGDGEVIMIFSGGAYDTQTEAEFDTWLQANYPETPAWLTAEISFSLNPKTQRLELDGSNYPTGNTVAVPKDDYYELSSDGAADFDGILTADADNVDTHVVTAHKKKGSDDSIDTSYNGTARLLITAGLPLSSNDFNFASGVATVTIGPVDKICDFRLSAVDTSDLITRSDTNLRFK